MSNVISRPIAFSVLLVVALACSLVVARPALATTELDQSQDVVDEVFRVQPNIGSASYNGGAQTVTAGLTGELFAVELYLQRESFTTQDLIVELHSLAPDGAILATSDPVAAADIPVAPPAATPAPTAPSTDDQGELPDTRLPAAPPSYEPLLMVLVLAASCGSLVVAYRAASRR